MQRILSTAVLVGLLVATAAAFAITERLKLTKSPIIGTKVVRMYVSPRAHTTAAVRVRFRRADRVTATIQDAHGHEVDTLAYRAPARRGFRTYVWNGRTDTGGVARDGTYRLEVHFASQRRTVLLPNPLVLESRRPAVLTARVVPQVFSPDGDHQSDHVAVEYTLNEGAHVVVSVGTRRVVLGRAHKPKDKVTWGGVVAGKLLPPGRYVLTVGAVDLAGNKAVAVQHVNVTLRYITLEASLVRVRSGGRIRIRVSTDAKRYRWSLAGRKGSATGRVLKLAAPRAGGTYTLTVSERGHVDTATVIVK